jgi:uncharacterized protein YfaS (alpha-2-macroglobulin family)
VDALCLMNLKTKAAPLVKEISALLSNNDWYSTQETSFALRAVTKFTGNNHGEGVRASLRINSSDPERIESQKALVSRRIEVRSGKKGILQVANGGKSILFARLILTGIPAYNEAAGTSNSLKITTSCKSMSGQVIKPNELSQGTGFIAEVSVTNPGMRGKYRQLALSQVFPSGWEVFNARNSDLAQSSQTIAVFDYQDVRDDRVNTFFDLDPGQTKTFRVMLMATYLGRFYLPPTGCEAMYDHTISAMVPGFWIEVVPASK